VRGTIARKDAKGAKKNPLRPLRLCERHFPGADIITRMEKGKIILLNGVSSSGKSTLARAITQQLPDYFHLGVDDFDLVIERMEDRPNGRLIPVATEVFFYQTVAMFSDQGVNLVVDDILHDAAALENCLDVLGSYPVLLVGVRCELEELERRELARGDRIEGLGRSQLAFVHTHEVYDVEVDTSAESPQACAERVIAAMRSGGKGGWQQTVKKGRVAIAR
jgi:chloramphenicol 3-O phosphotransferase